MDGILVVDKPQKMTSHDVVMILRKLYRQKRVGHSGTLDPMATGVLPVLMGQATRMVDFMRVPDDPDAKHYTCTIKFGIETDTQDIWGKVTRRHTDPASLPTDTDVRAVLYEFVGKVTQIPPMYSAVKVKGRKLYEYARKGIELNDAELKPREAFVNNIIIESYNRKEAEAVFKIECSKGTYVRTICADAGRRLGCGAVMSALRRTKSDVFLIEDAIPLETLRSMVSELPKPVPMERAMEHLPLATVGRERERKFVHGVAFQMASMADAEFARVIGPQGFLGIGCVQDGVLKPVRVVMAAH